MVPDFFFVIDYYLFQHTMVPLEAVCSSDHTHCLVIYLFDDFINVQPFWLDLMVWFLPNGG